MAPNLRTCPTPLGGALLLYATWTAATWYFEGRTGMLVRDDGGVDRVVYALAVNLLLGIGGALLLLRARGVAPNSPTPGTTGFDRIGRTALGTVAGLALGLAFYWLQGAPSRQSIVVANGFAQVFVVSAAEVMVCWVAVATAWRGALQPRLGRAATAAAMTGAALLFGLYHFAHSAPFNTWPMVGFLSVVGLFTGAFFFASRDAIATIVFHNFLGTYGVVKALVAADTVDRMAVPQWPLIGTAGFTLALLLTGGAWLRHGSTRRCVPQSRP